MNTAKFKKDGGPLYAEITSGFAHPGSYSLFIWEAHANEVVQEEKGNFINVDDDNYRINGTNEQLNGRIVDAGVTFIITPPIREYQAELIITQDGQTIGSDEEKGQTADRSKSLKLMVQLIQED